MAAQVRDNPAPKSQAKAKEKKPKESKEAGLDDSESEDARGSSAVSPRSKRSDILGQPQAKAMGLSEWEWDGALQNGEAVELSLEEQDLEDGVEEEGEGDEPEEIGNEAADQLEEEKDDDAPAVTGGEESPLPAVPILWNGEVEKFIDYFQKRKRSFAEWLEYAASYTPLMQDVLRDNGLPEDLVYLALIESGFNLHARSSANAQGPWQFVVGTGRRYGLKINRWIDERLDPIKSTYAASLYLKDLYDLMGGSWLLTKASYNAGEGRVLDAIRKTDNTDFWYLARNGYLPRETRNYVPMFMAAAIIAKDPEKFGFVDLNYRPLFLFDEVNVPERTSLRDIARWAETEYHEIRRLNPELKRGITPPSYPDYKVKIPVGSRDRFVENMVDSPAQKREGTGPGGRKVKPSSKVKAASRSEG